jgi:sugar/nucleoside kinase (ribokinase family)
MVEKNQSPVFAIIGFLSVDTFIQTRHLPIEGENVIAEHMLVSHGGKGATTAITCSFLNKEFEIRMLGQVGNDREGREFV